MYYLNIIVADDSAYVSEEEHGYQNSLVISYGYDTKAEAEQALEDHYAEKYID